VTAENARVRDELIVTGNTTTTMPENRAFYPALDGLRAIAFLLVFGQHYFMLPWGWTGVNIFFVLSGFLITGILYDTRNDTHRARNFYIRRALRIFPLYYAVVLGVVLTNPAFHWNWSLYWLAWPCYIANFLPYISHSMSVDQSPLQLAAFAWLRPLKTPQITFFLGHLWSLCVEEQFYFIWPWIVFWVKSRRALVRICSAVVILVPILRLIAQHEAPAWMLHADILDRATPFQVDSLLLGALIALLVRGEYSKILPKIGRTITVLFLVVAACVVGAGVAHSYPNWRAGYPYPGWMFTWGLTFVNLLTAGMILWGMERSSFFYNSLSLRPLRWMGRISYGAYVFHGIFQSIYWGIILLAGTRVKFIGHHPIFFTSLLGLTSTVLLSWISFEYFESPFLNLKERWTVKTYRDLDPTIALEQEV
jgi:peptidoglycan/LPS O-acetylase OafA/YrhL